MGRLMSFRELISRVNDGDDPFELNIEKWERIKNVLESDPNEQEVLAVFQSAQTKVAFCLEFEEDCDECPLYDICQDEESPYRSVVEKLYLHLATAAPLNTTDVISNIDLLLDEIRRTEQQFKIGLH